jgi:trehalose 6-phosphate synthase
MNLVAKEYCACRIDEKGVLILSQFAGAAEQLKTGALLVNPYDVEEVADTILEAFRMTDTERTARMKRMRRVVREENVFRWVDSFLKVGAKLAARPARVASRGHLISAR